MTAEAASAAHDGLLYSSDEELVAFADAFVRDGLANDEAVVVVANDRTRSVLEPVLSPLGPVTFLGPPEVFRRAATAVLAYQDLVERAVASGSRRLRTITEVDFGENPRALTESLRFEAVATLALADESLWNVCLYDVRRTPPDLLAAGTHAHPHLVDRSGRRPNPDFLPPAELLRRHTQGTPYRIESDHPDLDLPDVGALGLARLRTMVHETAVAGSTLPTTQIEDLTVALDEVATNALTHGSGPVGVRIWVSLDRVVGTVTDAGRGFDDPLAGFLPVALEGPRTSGAGLWLARNLSDSLDFVVSERGFTARLAAWAR